MSTPPLDLSIYRELVACGEMFSRAVTGFAQNQNPANPLANASSITFEIPAATSTPNTAYISSMVSAIKAMTVNGDTTPTTTSDNLVSVPEPVHAAYAGLIAAMSTAIGSGTVTDTQIPQQCKAYNTTWNNFVTAWKTVPGLPQSFAVVAFYYVKSKVAKPTGAGASAAGPELHQFHVARLAKITYYRMAYSICASVLRAASAALATGTTSLSGVTTSDIKLVGDKTDRIFFQIVKNENEMHFADYSANRDPNMMSLADRYVELKELSLTNADMSQSVLKSQGELAGYRQTLQTAMHGELMLKRMHFWTGLWKWVWTAVLGATIAMVIIFQKEPTVFYFYSAAVVSVMVIMWIMQAFNVMIPVLNPLWLL